MADNTLIINNQRYKVVADNVDQEQIALIVKYLDTYYDLGMEAERIKEQVEEAKEMLTQMFGKGFEENGLKSIKGKYAGVTYVPAKEPTIEETREIVWDDVALDKLIDELGVLKADFQKEVVQVKEKSGRKAYIKVELK